MNSSDYRHQIVVSIQDLILCRDNVFDCIVNLALKGELRHLDGAVDAGETYPFTMNHFRGLDDENIRGLIRIFDLVKKRIAAMMEENGIADDEIQFEG